MNQGIKQEKRKPERQKKNQACTGFERVRIPYKPEFFFRLSFRNCKSCVYTAMIFFHLKYGTLRYHAALIIWGGSFLE